MRYSRLLAVVGVAGAVTFAIVLAVRSSPAAPRAVRATARAPHTTLKRTLREELQQFLAAHPPAARPPRSLTVPAAGGQTCFVGPGTCSLTPCVIPAQGAAPTPVPASTAAPTPVRASSAAPTAVSTSTAIPTAVQTSAAVVADVPTPVGAATIATPRAVRSLPAPAASCRRGGTTPHVLRVAGP